MGKDQLAVKLLGCFASAGNQLEHAAWLVFLHELSHPEWPVGPPPGHSWEEITTTADGELGERLDAAVAACRRRWPLQLEGVLEAGTFAGTRSHELRRALETTEKYARIGPRGRGPMERSELLGTLTMTSSGNWGRQARGEFYTPANVADLIARMITPQPGEWVLEPTCGTGQLLCAAIAGARRRLGPHLAGTITYVGVELSAAAAQIARMQLVLSGHPEDGYWIFRGDSLRQAVVGRDREGDLRTLEWDVVLANPPFGNGKLALPLEAGEPLEIPERVLYRSFAVPSAQVGRLAAGGRLIPVGSAPATGKGD